MTFTKVILRMIFHFACISLILQRSRKELLFYPSFVLRTDGKVEVRALKALQKTTAINAWYMQLHNQCDDVSQNRRFT